jgi:hypothetical protein
VKGDSMRLKSIPADELPSTLTWAILVAACPGLQVVALDMLAGGLRRHPAERLPKAFARAAELVGPRRRSHSGPAWLGSAQALRVVEDHLRRLAGAGAP